VQEFIDSALVKSGLVDAARSTCLRATMSRLCFTFVPAWRGKELVRPVRDTLWAY